MPTLAALALLASFLPPPQHPGLPPPQDPGLDAKVDGYLATAMREQRIPGLSLAVFRDGVEVRASGHGVASLELQAPVTADTVFAIASVTKCFCATVAMQLVAAGKLGLEQPIGELLPALPETWRAVTVAQLLSHTSGLPDVIVNPVTGEWLGKTRDEALAKAAALPLQFAPGQSWSYNQTNYLLLGMLVEQHHPSFDAAVKERLLAPLSLAATAFGDASEVLPQRSSWYSAIEWDGQQPRRAARLHPVFIVYPPWMHTAAGLNTTARELARFVEAVAGGKLLGERERERMWTATRLHDGKVFRMDGTLGVGLGWLVDDAAGHRAVGGTGGSSVAFRHYRDDRLTVVVLTNLQGIDPDALVAGVAAIYVPALAAPR